MYSILLVDDETVISAQFARTLGDFGFEVELAHTVESGLARLQKVRFDAILVEFNLKSEYCDHARTGNGLDMIRQLHALWLAKLRCTGQ